MPQTVFIADLHLSDSTPELNRLFIQALDDWQGRVDALYILGDLFEAWLGDDAADGAALAAAARLKAFSAETPVYFICGNRDFLVGRRYAERAGFTILPEQYAVSLYGKRYLLSHGDEMCTADTGYQRFRRLMRCPIVQKLLLSLPLALRRKIAAKMRQKSRQIQNRRGYVPAADVTESGVQAAFTAHPGCSALIHGHTHRPDIHRHQVHGQTVERYVVPDWYGNEGGYLAVSPQGAEMKKLALRQT